MNFDKAEAIAFEVTERMATPVLAMTLLGTVAGVAFFLLGGLIGAFVFILLVGLGALAARSYIYRAVLEVLSRVDSTQNHSV